MGNSYDLVALTLGNRESRKVANNSYLVQTEGKWDREGHPGQRGTLAYKLHETFVVLYHHNGSVELNTGGWRTVTTKDRINRCLRDYGPHGFGVYSDRGVWYLYHDGAKVAGFEDGMVIHEDGSVTGGADTDAKDASNERLRKLLKRYLAGLTPGKLAAALANPAGDCMYCAWRTEDGRSIGQVTNDKEHLWMHLEERYYMSSLFQNAVQAAGHGSPPFVWGIILQDSNANRVSTFLTRDLSRYFRAQLKQA